MEDTKDVANDINKLTNKMSDDSSSCFSCRWFYWK